MKLITRIKNTAAIGLTILVAAGSNAHAADDYTAPPDSGWEFTVAPFYGWLPGLYGDVAALGAANTVEVDLSPLDFGELLLENLDFAAIGAVEARKDDLGVLVDLMHMQLSGATATPRGIFFADAELSASITMLTGMGAYRVVESDQMHVDLLAGARIWSVDVDLDLTGGTLGPRSADDGDTWVDPMVGFKGRYQIDDVWSLSGWGMIGAGSSDISWDMYAALNYEVREGFNLLAGYRAVGIDYESNGFVFDLILAGPLVGATWTF